jgi:hypothetical protein
MYQRDQNNSLFLGGERTTGQDVRASNGKFYLTFDASFTQHLTDQNL